MPVSRRQGLPKLMAPFLKLREDKIDTTPVFEGLEDIIYTVPRSKPKFEIDMIGRESHTVEQMVPAQSAAAALEIILLAALRTGVTIREVTTTSPIHTRVGFPAEIMRVDELLALFLRKGSLSTARTAIKRFGQYIEANQNAIRRMQYLISARTKIITDESGAIPKSHSYKCAIRASVVQKLLFLVQERAHETIVEPQKDKNFSTRPNKCYGLTGGGTMHPGLPNTVDPLHSRL
ncbi:hypothetical protein PCE1_000926 [Barthelona sp. PCE]